MSKELNEQINLILKEKDIDVRVKPLIKMYFQGKLSLEELSLNEIQAQIDFLCSRISNVEFSSNNIVSAYSSKSNVLTINKQLFLDGKADEAILPVFMKFEEALNQSNQKSYARHIKDFIQAGRIAKEISAPISDRLIKLYEIAEYSYGDIEHKNEELAQDGSWRGLCSEYDTALNRTIITGKDDSKGLLNAANLFHFEVFTAENLDNPDFEGPFKNEEYQKKAARILAYLDNSSETSSLIRNIKLFTGCTEEMINAAQSKTYTGDSRISTILETAIQNRKYRNI